MLNAFNQFSETDPLKKVIIGRYEGYRKVNEYVEIVNESQKEGLPSPTQLKSEFDALSALLKERGIEVLVPDYVGKFVYDQLTPRDLGVTIDSKFVVCNMAKRSRRYESAGIFRHILSMEGKEPDILLPPDNDILLEGGDIIIDKEMIFVGITQRSNKKGFQFLESTFGDQFDVIPIHCESFDEKEQVLHLDCVFNPVGHEHALIYTEGLKEIPEAITQNYKFIEVDQKAQQFLATNVLSLDEKTVISRDHPACRAANEAMRKVGLEVITLPFNGAPKTGGSFRCCTLPLVRGGI